MKPTFAIITGTAREGNLTHHVSQFVSDYAKTKSEFATVTVDVAEFPQTHTKGLVPDLLKKYTDIITSAQGIIIVTPEYNHSIPGELKMLIDNLYAEYNYKPFGLCGVSIGPMGGVRATEALKVVISELQGVPTRNCVYFGNAAALFDASGAMTGVESWHKRLDTMFTEMLSWTAK